MKRMSKTLRMQWEEVMDRHVPIFTILNPWERVIVPAPTTLPPFLPPSRAAIFQQSLVPAADTIAMSQQALIGAA